MTEKKNLGCSSSVNWIEGIVLGLDPIDWIGHNSMDCLIFLQSAVAIIVASKCFYKTHYLKNIQVHFRATAIIT